MVSPAPFNLLQSRWPLFALALQVTRAVGVDRGPVMNRSPVKDGLETVSWPHSPFLLAGIESLFLFADDITYINSPEDTVERLQMEPIVQSVELRLEIIDRLVNVHHGYWEWRGSSFSTCSYPSVPPGRMTATSGDGEVAVHGNRPATAVQASLSGRGGTKGSAKDVGGVRSPA